MIKLDLKKTALVGFSLTAIALALSGCGGGSSSATVAGVGPSGKVTDGYVKNAAIWVDKDNNGSCEFNTGVTTNLTGDFTLGTEYNGFTICAKGGTDISTDAPFVGELKAPAGSKQITPVTTLVQATLPVGVVTQAQIDNAATAVANKLGLTGTNLLTADPVALAVSNPKLAQTTAAVQTLLIQAANNVAAAANGSTVLTQAKKDEQTAALFSSAVAGVAAAVTSLAANTVVDLTSTTTTGTAAATALITTAISNTVATAKADPVVVAAVATAASLPTTSVTNLAATSVAAASAANIAAVTQVVASTSATVLTTAPAAGTVSVSFAAQRDTSAAQTTQLVSGLLTTAAATATTSNSVAAITALATTVSNNLSSGSAAAAAAAVTTQIAAVVQEKPAVTVPEVVVPVIPTLTNVVVISAPKLNNVAVSTTVASPYPVTVTGPLTSASMTLTATGTPALTQGMFGIAITDASGPRVLKLVIDNVTLSNTSGVVSATVPTGAKLYAYGVHANGTVSEAVLSNVAANMLTVTNNALTVNWSSALTTLTAQSGFASLSSLTGTFNVTAAMSGAPLAKLTAIQGATAVAADVFSVSIAASTANGNTGASFTGGGERFLVTVK